MSDAESKRGRGGSGHPEPGSGHDDSKTETVDQGPDVPIVDGGPGAHGTGETEGGATTATEPVGKGVVVAEEMGS